MPQTHKEDPDGTYTIGEDGTLQRYKEGESELKEDVEQLLPEEEQYNFIFRTSFHTTPRTKKLGQRENIFQTKCKV